MLENEIQNARYVLEKQILEGKLCFQKINSGIQFYVSGKQNPKSQ